MATKTEDDQYLELLICGYVRENENALKLFMNIPTEISRILCKLYPVLLFKFGDYEEGKFILSEDDTILKGNGDSCDAYLCYADLGKDNDIGLNKGIHFWTIKSVLHHDEPEDHDFAECYCSIGVTTKKDNKAMSESWSHTHMHWIDITPERCYSYLDIFFNHNMANIVTMKLNCNDWTVTYYVDEEQIKVDEIEADNSYYLAVCCCDQSSSTQILVIDTPTSIRGYNL